MILVALLLAACSSAPAGDGWQPRPPGRETLGWLGDQPVTYGQIGRYIRIREPDVFSRSLTRYLLERITLEEARPLGVTVPAALLTRETSRRMRAWEQRVRSASRERTGKEIDPALWLQRVADLSVANFRAQVREGAEVELMQDRLLRYELLTAARIEVSILVVAGRQRAGELVGELKRGGDFAALARRHSQHPSAPDGGRIPYPLVQADFSEPGVRDALFAAPVKSILGPFPVPSADFHQIYRLEAVHAAAKGSYIELEKEVARDLATRPVPMGEYEHWRRRILLRHGFRAEAAPGEPG